MALSLLLTVRFRWKRLVRPGFRSERANGPGWLQASSGVRLLPGYKATGTVVTDGKVSAEYTTEILEHTSTQQPVFRCTVNVLSPTGQERTFVVDETSPSRAFSSMIGRLGCAAPGHKSGPEFFGYNRPAVQLALQAALCADVPRLAPSAEDEFKTTKGCTGLGASGGEMRTAAGACVVWKGQIMPHAAII